jgi:hypothetical protein
MQAEKHKKTKPIPVNLIAPCGMNCRLCWGYIREKNSCPGCLGKRDKDTSKSKYRNHCKIKNCEQILSGKIKYCSDSCESFPCKRLKQLDKRYSAKYGMSMIENLHIINESGIRHFIRNERERWTCPECGEIICVHKPACLSCGLEWKG